jgi:hypothetical protein
MLISAGNTDNFSFGAGQYLDRCDLEDNEIQSPVQAWNALAIGAFTEKTGLPDEEAAATTALAHVHPSPNMNVSTSERCAIPRTWVPSMTGKTRCEWDKNISATRITSSLASTVTTFDDISSATRPASPFLMITCV